MAAAAVSTAAAAAVRTAAAGTVRTVVGWVRSDPERKKREAGCSEHQWIGKEEMVVKEAALRQ